eukprot:8475064-Pyramimonas_sp.AAC.1
MAKNLHSVLAEVRDAEQARREQREAEDAKQAAAAAERAAADAGGGSANPCSGSEWIPRAADADAD